MYKWLITLILLATLISCSQHITPQADQGTLEHLPDFESAYIGERHVDVWLPEGYSEDKQYPVFYMHDGQNLFDTTTAFMGSEWGVDETLSALQDTAGITPPIVVGIWNSGRTRPFDYMPEQPVQKLSKEEVKEAKEGLGWLKRFSYNLYDYQADEYLQFLIQELKPYIDSNYATRPGREHTFVGGSSMGGLISWYALSEYPGIFGGAACLSTHWPGTYNPDNPLPNAFIKYLKKRLPRAGYHKLYFDYGTESLDSMYAPYQNRVDSIMQAKGYTGKDWMTKKFPGAGHNQAAWRKRLHIPMLFLLEE